MAESQIITIVLVHGAFAESLSNWKPVLELLLAKGYKVVAAPKGSTLPSARHITHNGSLRS